MQALCKAEIGEVAQERGGGARNSSKASSAVAGGPFKPQIGSAIQSTPDLHPDGEGF